MKTGMRARLGVVMLALAAAIAALGSRAGAQSLDAGQEGPLAPGRRSRTLQAAPRQVLREIDDPHSGMRWLLLRDSGHPGGPGLLIPASAVKSESRHRSPTSAPDPVPLHPVIRAGDLLIVEEHTALADACLEAVALGPAVLGSALPVRLKIGGKVVQAMALAPGRAALEQVSGARP